MTALDRKDELSDKAEGWSKSPHKSFGYKQEKSLIIQMGNSNSFPKVIKEGDHKLRPRSDSIGPPGDSSCLSIRGRMADRCFQPHSHLSQGVFTKLLQ